MYEPTVDFSDQKTRPDIAALGTTQWQPSSRQPLSEPVCSCLADRKILHHRLGFGNLHPSGLDARSVPVRGGGKNEHGVHHLNRSQGEMRRRW